MAWKKQCAPLPHCPLCGNALVLCSWRGANFYCFDCRKTFIRRCPICNLVRTECRRCELVTIRPCRCGKWNLESSEYCRHCDFWQELLCSKRVTND